jgi:peptidoglycan DL-endopeptidase CwlO
MNSQTALRSRRWIRRTWMVCAFFFRFGRGAGPAPLGGSGGGGVPDGRTGCGARRSTVFSDERGRTTGAMVLQAGNFHIWPVTCRIHGVRGLVPLRALGFSLPIAALFTLSACSGGGAEASYPVASYSPYAAYPSYTPPSPAPPVAATAGPAASVLAYATAQVGRPYCWGGTGPGCFDCSGLTQKAWQQVGVQLPRTADDVAKKLRAVPLTEVRPGDILWWPGHVALYAGNGWSVEALDKKSGVVMRRAPRPKGAFRPAAVM